MKFSKHTENELLKDHMKKHRKEELHEISEELAAKEQHDHRMAVYHGHKAHKGAEPRRRHEIGHLMDHAEN